MIRRTLLAALAAALAAATPAVAQPAPDTILDAFEGAVGRHQGHRVSFAKGVCASGHFEATPEARGLTSSAVFAGPRVPATIRLGVGGGNPRAGDNMRGTRSLSVHLEAPGGETWDTANISAPFFAAATPENLLRLLQASRPDPATGRVNAEAVTALVNANPDLQAQRRYLAENAPPASWATSAYWGVNAFRFRNAAGEVRHVRWVFEPAAGVQRLTEEQMRTMPADFLADELRRRVAAGPVAFDMVAQIAGPGDNLVNPTVEWPADRQRVRLGRLTVTGVEPGPGGACQGMSFLQLESGPGIEASDDPTLAARTPVYATALGRRS
jgi:catalase